MKKLKKKLKEANKILEKLSKENHFDNEVLKTVANTLDTKINESKSDLKAYDELKSSLDVKKEKLANQKTEIKGLIKELNKLSGAASKEHSKKKETEQSDLKAKKDLEAKKRNDIETKVKKDLEVKAKKDSNSKKAPVRKKK
ncbi:MAG TPA: hypothetical protein DCQ31_05830 [Bacteroidales bacterium]|nr:hypothetical protein [Bacteroidales bacterium]